MFELVPGESFLVCSDGLYRELDQDVISACLAMEDCHQACDALIDRALAGGARDNISVVVVRVLDEDQVTRTRYNPSLKPVADRGRSSDDPTVC
jgi:serine/threonine protein phosphatase PrpC